MSSAIAALRRDVLLAAGVSFATSLLEGATAEAQTQTPVSSICPAISEFNGKLYAVCKDATARDFCNRNRG